MTTTTTINPKDKFLEAFSGLDKHEEAAELMHIKTKALESLKHLEFPTTRDENWKYTRVSGIAKSDYKVGKPEVNEINIDKYKVANLDAYVLVFVNGFYVAELSDIVPTNNIVVKNIQSAKKEYVNFFETYFAKQADYNGNIFTALNTAYSQDGTFIYIPDRAVAEKPIHIINLTKGDNIISQPRLLIVAGKSSQAKVVLTYETISGNNAFTNVVTEVHVQENAVLEIDKVQYESSETAHISTEQIYQEANSVFSINTVTLSGGLVRNNLNIVLDAEGSESNLYGLYLTKDKQHVDNHTLVDHRKPHCQSNELYKGIMDDQSTGVFNGKVFVRQDAQKTNAYQSNKNILLSNDATINTKPELEIYADDVKCSHGSTTGQLDKDGIFYFQARGIGEEKARNLLMYAFASDVIENIKIEPLKEKIKVFLDKKFNN